MSNQFHEVERIMSSQFHEVERIMSSQFHEVERIMSSQVHEIAGIKSSQVHEIRASLQGIRQKYNPDRIWCIFQPHQYSRTRFLLDNFAESFKLADITIVPEIYFVRDTESSRKEVNSEQLVERIRMKGSEAFFIDGFDRICEYLESNVKSGDVVVTMGAGDIWKVSDEYIQWVR